MGSFIVQFRCDVRHAAMVVLELKRQGAPITLSAIGRVPFNAYFDKINAEMPTHEEAIDILKANNVSVRQLKYDKQSFNAIAKGMQADRARESSLSEALHRFGKNSDTPGES